MHHSVLLLTALSWLLCSCEAAKQTLLQVAATQIPSKNQTANPRLTFEVSELDYGTIRKNSNPVRSVRFTNTGDTPFSITTIQSNCGCLTTVFPTATFYPGQSGNIELRYDTKRIGIFEKSITVNLYNQSGTFSLKVIGEVLEEEDGSRVVVVMPPRPAPKPQAEPEFSNWYTAKVDGKHTLSCRYKASKNGRIELELQCTDGCRFEVSSKLCSRTPDGDNGWKSVRLIKNKVSRITIYERADNCRDGFWWWYRKYGTTSARYDR